MAVGTLAGLPVLGSGPQCFALEIAAQTTELDEMAAAGIAVRGFASCSSMDSSLAARAIFQLETGADNPSDDDEVCVVPLMSWHFGR